ncbi:MAG: hypothetical protein K1X79_01555 [Oligoflexia bacterium]|nr:hypothetical protein [Oligoflexia bacterium]
MNEKNLIEKRRWTAEEVVLFLLTLSDLLMLVIPKLGTLVLSIWFVSFAYIARAAICPKEGLRQIKKAPLTTLAIVAIATAFVWLAQNPANVSHESTQQLGCALEKLTAWPHTGVQEDCFLGYPARQYFVPALPTIFFGRSALSLNIGQVLYLLVGLLAMARGMLGLFNSQVLGDVSAAALIVSTFQSYFFRYQLLNFEQSIYPIAFGFIVVGFALRLYRERSNRWLALTSLGLYHATFAYTPALALLPLGALALLIACYINFGGQRWRYCLNLAMVLCAVAVSFVFRIDVILFPRHAGSVSVSEKLDVLWSVFANPWQELALFNIPLKIMSAVFVTWLWIYTLCWLVGLFKQRGADVPNVNSGGQTIAGLMLGWAVLVWSVATIIISVVSPGYANPPAEFAVHRALVIWPVLLGGLSVMLSQMENIRVLLIPLALASGVFFTDDGIKKVRHFQDEKFANRHYLLLDWLAKHNLLGEMALIFSPSTKDFFLSLADEATYFSPNIRYTFWNTSCTPERRELVGKTTIMVEMKDQLSGCPQRVAAESIGSVVIPEGVLQVYKGEI